MLVINNVNNVSLLHLQKQMILYVQTRSLLQNNSDRLN